MLSISLVSASAPPPQQADSQQLQRVPRAGSGLPWTKCSLPRTCGVKWDGGREPRWLMSLTNQPPGLIACTLTLLPPILESCVRSPGSSRAPVPHFFQVWGHQAESRPGCCDLQADSLLTSCAVTKGERQRVGGKKGLRFSICAGDPRVSSLRSLLASAVGHPDPLPSPLPLVFSLSSPLWAELGPLTSRSQRKGIGGPPHQSPILDPSPLQTVLLISCRGAPCPWPHCSIQSGYL